MDSKTIQHGECTIRLISVPIVSDDTCAELGEAIAKTAAPVLIQMDRERWQWIRGEAERDLVEIMKAGEFDQLVSHLAGTVVARRFTMYDGKRFDAEFQTAADAAKENELSFELIDRNQTVSFQRSWRRTSWHRRIPLFFWFLSGLIRAPFRLVTESRSAKDVLEAEEARFQTFQAADSYVTETANWMANEISRRQTDALVLCRPHLFVPLESALRSDLVDVAAIATAPPKSFVSRVLPWAISAAIVSAFVAGFVYGDFEKMEHAVWAWVLINGTLAGLGTMIAGGHVTTIVATALTAPLVSLNPAVGAGMVGAFVQSLVRPPTLEDIQSVGDAIANLRGWWSNRLARVILIFFLANAFSTIGSFTALAWFPAF